VTRPQPGATATASRLVAAGWTPVLAPFLTVRPARVALPGATSVQAVVAASGNAVALPIAYTRLPLLAVGNATASRARAAGFSTVHSADGDAVALAGLAARLLDPARGPLLLTTGRGQGTALARALQKGGFTVRRRAVYASAHVRRFPEPAADAITSGLHAALFFSTETARAFARLLPASLRPYLGHTDAAVIAPGAAQPLMHLPWRTLRVALRPTQDEVLALL
jgi:uroporphyrinogen-III synthase